MALTSTSTFGTSGFTMPAVGLGTYLMSPDEAEATTKHALGSAGYTHVDTAEVYRNEDGVGKAIRSLGKRRADIYITTKLWPGNPAWGMPLKDGAAAAVQLDKQLALLGVDYVDLYLVHAPFTFTASETAGLELWQGLLALKASGKCKAVGVSNYGVKHLQAIKDAGLELPSANQIELHPLSQQSDIVAWCRANDVLPIAYSSLAPMAGWRVKASGEAEQSSKKGQVAALDAAVAAAATRAGVSAAQVLLRWGLQKGYPILPKSVVTARIDSNLDLFGFAITADEMAAIDAAGATSPGPMTWPNGMDPTK